MKNFKLIIFDLDGTLIQNPLFYTTIYSQSLDDLIRELQGEKGLETLAYCRKNLNGRGELALAMLNIPYSAWAEKLQQLPLDLVKKDVLLVQKIKNLKAKKVIYTGSPLLFAKRILRKTGFSLTEFEEIIGWEKSEEFPMKWSLSSYIFSSLMKKYDSTSSTTLAIGDNWKTDLFPAEKQEIKTMNIKNKEYLIAGGNPTILSSETRQEERKNLIEKYLGKKVDQIGFISEANTIPTLSMMGDELCINATLAFASTLDAKGYLKTSGIKSKVYYENSQDSESTIAIRINFKKNKNIVLLSGIGFVYSDTEKQLSKRILREYCMRYNLPAFGLISYKENKLRPLIYVLQTNSLIEETACGSGSIALNILLGLENITQPSGEIISVRRKSNTFFVSANIKNLSLL